MSPCCNSDTPPPWRMSGWEAAARPKSRVGGSGPGIRRAWGQLETIKAPLLLYHPRIWWSWQREACSDPAGWPKALHLAGHPLSNCSALKSLSSQDRPVGVLLGEGVVGAMGGAGFSLRSAPPTDREQALPTQPGSSGPWGAERVDTSLQGQAQAGRVLPQWTFSRSLQLCLSLWLTRAAEVPAGFVRGIGHREP